MEKKILITDDAAFMRLMITRILAPEGYTIIEACDGLDMLKKYEEHHPDLVTLDVTMPNMDGVTAVKELKKRYPESKIIMCSAMGQKVIVMDAMKAGANDFIVKPFKKETVLETINRVLGKK